MKSVVLKVSDFSKTPFGRYYSDGKHCGQAFRDEHLIPLINSYDLVNIELDGVLGYGSSFLEEVFGGLLRAGYSNEYLKNSINVITEDEHYRLEINEYMETADYG